MQIPVSLDDWSLDLVRRLVTSPDGEPVWFDFKEALNARDSQWNAKLSKAACAMANTGGGFLVFGVLNQMPMGGTPVDRIIGVPITGEERHDFGQKMARIRVNVAFDAKMLPLPGGTCVVVIHIPESRLRPHMFEGKFYKRGDGGNVVTMDVYEVRDQMLFTQDRLAKVLLFRIRLVRFHRLAATIIDYNPHYHLCIENFDVSAYDALLPDVFSLLPTDYLLDRLMTVSEKAHTVNATMERVIRTVSNAAVIGDVQPSLVLSELWDIQRCCREAEERLEKAFRPLPAGYELRCVSCP